jgi:CRISPR-associated protein Csx17
VADVARLLRGELDVKQIHRLVPLYALLDWRNRHEAEWSPKVATPSAIPPAYVILRCWVDLAIYPPKDEAGERDGTIIRLLTAGRPQEASRAAALALRRLRIRGLPARPGDTRPFGKAVARAEVVVLSEEAQRLALAVLVPMSTNDMLVLADRLRVESPERQTKEMAT